MVGSISGVSTSQLASLTALSPDALTARSITTANTALSLLLNASDITAALAARTSIYLPPSSPLVMSSLWGLINTSGNGIITKSDLEKAVFLQGGSSTSADALWTQLNPDKKSALKPGDFVKNAYLNGALSLSMKSIEEAVLQQQWKDSASGGSNSILDSFAPGGGTVLDLFA